MEKLFNKVLLQRVLRPALFILALTVGGVLNAQEYNYEPEMGDYVIPGSTSDYVHKNSAYYSGCSFPGGNYYEGHVKVALYDHDVSTGDMVFRVRKCDNNPYFSSGSTGTIYVLDTYYNRPYCTDYYVPSSGSYRYREAFVYDYGNFTGTRTFEVFLIPDNAGGDRYYAGSVVITRAPNPPYNPNPYDGAEGVSVNPTLSWSCSSPGSSIDYYEVYVRTPDHSYDHCFYTSSTSYTIPSSYTLDNDRLYYWRIRAVNSLGAVTPGERWEFTTEAEEYNCFDDCTSSSCGQYGYQMYVAAQYLCDLGIVQGVNGDLEPDVDITRGQLAKVALYGLYGSPYNVPSILVTDYFPSIYSDLQNEYTYYYRAAKTLLYLEYGDGVSPFDRDRSCFNPSGNIPRCFVLKVLLETFNIEPLSYGSNVFDDFGPSGYTNSAFWGYAQKAYNLGIVQTTHFRPDDYCTRGEAFLYLYRILSNDDIVKPVPVNTEDPSTSDFFIPTDLSPDVLNAIRGVEYGNFNYYEKDFFAIPGYMDLNFGIAYNSYLTEMPGDYYPVNPLGKAWTHTYDLYMNVISDMYNNTSILVFHMQDGSLLLYENDYGDITSLTDGNYYDLSTSGSNKYILKSREQISYTFERQSVSDGIYYLTKIKDRNNNTINISYSYGIDHYRIESVSTMGRVLDFHYTSGTDLLRYVEDPIGRRVYFYYTDGQLTSLKNAKNQISEFTYGTFNIDRGLLKSIKLPEGNYVYNNYEQRKLVSMRRVYNNNNYTHTAIEISPNYQDGFTTSTVTTNLNNSQHVTTVYTMNENNRITNVTSGNHTDISYEYNIDDKPDLVSKVINHKTNVQTLYEYNDKGLPTEVTVLAGGETHTTTAYYNGFNDIESCTDANGNETVYNYNSQGNLIGVTDALGHTTDIVNNSHGKPTRVTDPMGVYINYYYDEYGNIDQITIPSLNKTCTYSYDGVSRVESRVDYAGHMTSYTYDNNDNLLTETDAMGNTTIWHYDDNDNVDWIQNARGFKTFMTYDDNDFLTQVSFQGASRSYSYNRDGSMSTYTDPNGHTFNYTYNSSGELTGDGISTLDYNYKGQLESVTKDGMSVECDYDAFGRATSISYDGKTVSYSYDNNGNVLSITYPGNKTVSYSYDALNRISTVTDWNNATTTYHYRNDGQMNYYQYPNGVRTTYNYDSSGRCVGFSTKRNSGYGSVIAEYGFELDDSGNHVSESFTEPYADYPSMPTESINYTCNSANRLITAGNLSFGYDNNGNTAYRTGRSYSYDVYNNLTSVDGDYTATYTYDGLNNRRSATRNGMTTKYVLDILAGSPTVLMETDASGVAQNYYIYGASGLVSRVDANNNTSYYVYDYRGSTVAMTDASTSANITHQYQYDDFGKLLQVEEADPNSFRYVGKYGVMYEDETLYFMRARYYDPETGRFLSEDPIWSTNLYPYADNNPIVKIDSDGNDATIFNTIDNVMSWVSLGEDVLEIYGIKLFGEKIALGSYWNSFKLGYYLGSGYWMGVFTSAFSLIPGVDLDPYYTELIIDSFCKAWNQYLSSNAWQKYLPQEYYSSGDASDSNYTKALLESFRNAWNNFISSDAWHKYFPNKYY